MQYQEAIETSRSIVNMYHTLAELEKQGKKETKEYRDVTQLILFMIDVEKRKYSQITNEKILLSSIQTSLTMYAKEQYGYFMYPKQEILVMLRILNRIDMHTTYDLDGIVYEEVVQELKKNINRSFYNQLHRYAYDEELSKEENDVMIDFKYGLMSYSKDLEDSYLEGELIFPFTNTSMNNSQLHASSTYIFPLVRQLVNYLEEIEDNDIMDQTLPVTLYANACLRILPHSLLEGFVKEITGCIDLKRNIEMFMHIKTEKVCNMLTYLATQSMDQKQSKQKI